MATSSEEWSTDANEAVKVSLLQRSQNNLHTLHEFHPKFTYPIFGEEQRIFGYKGLEIHIKFAAHDLTPEVNLSYKAKFKPVGSTEALDLNKTLKEFLPESAFDKHNIPQKASADHFRPPGQLVHSYSRSGCNFEIWAGSLLDPTVREMLDNIQILVVLFIEGGTYIDTDDVDWTLNRWKVYFLYEVLKNTTSASSPYSLAGYATTYRFWSFHKSKKGKVVTSTFISQSQDIAPTTLPSRLRISQFLILPPYQSKGHGSSLYQTIYSEVMADSTIFELSIENPSEECDKLRDINDWRVLEPIFRTADIKINTSDKGRIARVPTSELLPIDALKMIQKSTKIADRQFARQLEMYLLSLIPYSHRAAGGASLTKLLVQKARASNADDKAYYWWRILVKQRITKKNKDLLQQLDLADRIPQVEDSTRGCEDEYEGLLMLYAALQLKDGNGAGEATSRTTKRKIIEDDDDDGEDADSVTSEAKRMKT